MHTRTLFLTLFTTLVILLTAQGLAFADPITGCVRKGNGVIYYAQIGEEPTYPCRIRDEEITWNQEGPQGPGAGRMVSFVDLQSTFNSNSVKPDIAIALSLPITTNEEGNFLIGNEGICQSQIFFFFWRGVNFL